MRHIQNILIVLQVSIAAGKRHLLYALAGGAVFSRYDGDEVEAYREVDGIFAQVASAELTMRRIFPFVTASSGSPNKTSFLVFTSTKTSVPSFSATMSNSLCPHLQFRCRMTYLLIADGLQPVVLLLFPVHCVRPFRFIGFPCCKFIKKYW